MRNQLRNALSWLEKYGYKAWSNGNWCYWIFEETCSSVPGSMGVFMGYYGPADILCLAADLRDLETADPAKEELGELVEEIGEAHAALTELGIGKPHWSLAGRIERLALQGAGVDGPITCNLFDVTTIALYYSGLERRLTEEAFGPDWFEDAVTEW